MALIRTLSVLLAAATTTAPALAQALVVTPAEGTIGTVLEITGGDFGSKKPKVRLVDDATGKTKTLKVVEHDAGRVLAEVKKAPAGTYDVVVLPKGKSKAALEADSAFVLRAPSDLDVPEGPFAPKDEVSLTARFLGDKKGKVRVGGKKARVLLWEAGDDDDPGGDAAQGTVRFEVPKSLPEGTFDVTVQNMVGQATADDALTVGDDGGGGGPEPTTIEAVTPAEGALGTTFTLTGSGFGDKKPKLELIGAGKAKAKVVSWSDTTIEALVKKGTAGSHDLRVTPKGGSAPATRADGFAIRAPADLVLAPALGAKGDEIVLSAAFMGSKKGKVRVGGKKAKLTEWRPGDGWLAFRVPRLPNGLHEVVLETRAGEATAPELFEVFGTPPKGGGKPAFSCELDGKGWSAKGTKKVGYLRGIGCHGDDCIALAGAKSGNHGFTIFMHDFDPTTDGPGEFYDVTVAYLKKDDLWSDFAGCATITANDGGVVSGTFEGVMELFEGEGEPIRVVTDGVFTDVPEAD